MEKLKRKPYVYGMLAGFGAISLSVIFFFILFRVQSIKAVVDQVMKILMPFVYGGVIAYLLCPMCNLYSRFLAKRLPKKLRMLAEPLAIILSIFVGLFSVYLLIIMVVPQLINSVVSMWLSIPGEMERLVAWLLETYGNNEEIQKVIPYLLASYDTLYSTVDAWATDTLMPYVTNIVSGVGIGLWKMLIFLKDLLIGIAVAIYLLANRKLFKRQGVLLIRGALKPKWADLVLDEIAFVDKMFGGFIEGKIVDSIIIGILCYIGCWIFRFPSALMVSAIIGVTNVIPIFGPFVGAVPATLLILIESPVQALWFMLFVLILQQLDGNVIGPLILGDATGVSSFWVLFSILLFGGLWGIVGMVIAVPLLAVIDNIIRRLVIKGLNKRGCAELMDEYHNEMRRKK